VSWLFDLLLLFTVVMEFNVGDSVEAIDHLGIWTKAKVVSKANSSVVVNFPLWRAEWDRGINNPSEIREGTAEENLIPCLSPHILLVF